MSAEGWGDVAGVASHGIVAVLWIAWCSLHSVLIATAVTRTARNLTGSHYRFYRAGFNIVALVSLLPVILVTRGLESPTWWTWQGGASIVRYILLAGALALFYLGGRHYDWRQFAGLQQIRSGRTHTTLTESGDLHTSGIMAWTRHPWYLASLIVVWCAPPNMRAVGAMVAVILTAYLIVGTMLEERKLVGEYGEAYREYQRRVPMLLPYRMPRSG